MILSLCIFQVVTLTFHSFKPFIELLIFHDINDLFDEVIVDYHRMVISIQPSTGMNNIIIFVTFHHLLCAPNFTYCIEYRHCYIPNIPCWL